MANWPDQREEFNVMSKKRKAARISVASNIILTAGKLTTGIYMGSISVIAEAAHSGLDLVAAIIAYFSIKKAEEPADERHRYGHGKFENLASIVEALLIIAVAVLIMIEAVPALLAGTKKVESLGMGAVVMGISALVNWWVSSMLLRVAGETDSPALAADGWHLRTDVYTSAGVFAGIVAIKFTGLTIFDPVAALVVTALILKAAFGLIRDSLRVMLDVKLPDEEEQVIHSVLQKYTGDYVEFHRLRTRKAGSQRHVDLHLVMPANKPLKNAHKLCTKIERDLKENLAETSILIHVEPCEGNCEECPRCPCKKFKTSTQFYD